MEENVKVPFWQKTWFIVIMCLFIPPAGIALLWVTKKGSQVLRIVLTVVLAIYSIPWLSGIFSGASSTDTQADTTEQTQQEEVVADTTTPEETVATEEAVATEETVLPTNTAVYAELFSGSWIVNTDVQPGRYLITTGSGSGNFFVTSANGTLMTNEILGNSDFGVTQIETTLVSGDTIEISGIDQVIFTPVDRTSRTSLPAGWFLAGIDIPAGTYTATSPAGSGNFIIYSDSGLIKTNEILGDSEYGVTQVRVSLNDGDLINISGINQVDFN
jgi:hypothetical protein